MRRLVFPAFTAAITALTLTAGATAPALAASEPAAGKGTTTVVIDPAVYDILTAAGTAVTPTGKANAAPFMGTVAAKFPITKISAAATGSSTRAASRSLPTASTSW